jgi:hypothetical protein
MAVTLDVAVQLEGWPWNVATSVITGIDRRELCEEKESS